MNKLKMGGLIALTGGGLTKSDWIFIISVLLTVLGMLQTYLENRKNGS